MERDTHLLKCLHTFYQNLWQTKAWPWIHCVLTKQCVETYSRCEATRPKGAKSYPNIAIADSPSFKAGGVLWPKRL